MKTTIKIALLISLFSTATFADGEMGNGGRTCNQNCCTENCFVGTDPVNDGMTASAQTEQDETILSLIQDYLGALFGGSNPE